MSENKTTKFYIVWLFYKGIQQELLGIVFALVNLEIRKRNFHIFTTENRG